MSKDQMKAGVCLEYTTFKNMNSYAWYEFNVSLLQSGGKARQGLRLNRRVNTTEG